MQPSSVKMDRLKWRRRKVTVSDHKQRGGTAKSRAQTQASFSHPRSPPLDGCKKGNGLWIMRGSESGGSAERK